MDILFVYNADSGKLNTLLDIAHKVISPSTYQCSLCSLTHDAFNEKSEWMNFRDSFPHNLQFLHKDEFEKKFSERYEYPVVLDTSDEIKLLISSVDLHHLTDVKDLISTIQERVTTIEL